VVELLGHLPPEGVRRELDRADVFLHTALSEGFGNAVLEAQAMEVPVVCSDAEGLRENVADGTSGIVVARGDSGATAAALLRLSGDRELRRTMGLAGRARVREKFRPEAQIDAFSKFYDAVMTGASAARSSGPA
jgi:colanic acid/amylovoran biosynthesis glycosyltransferase